MFPFGFTIRSELERTRDVHYLWRGLERALVRRALGGPVLLILILYCIIEYRISKPTAKSSRESPIGFSFGLFESGNRLISRIFDLIGRFLELESIPRFGSVLCCSFAAMQSSSSGSENVDSWFLYTIGSRSGVHAKDDGSSTQPVHAAGVNQCQCQCT